MILRAAGRRPSAVATEGAARKHRPDYWLLLLSTVLVVIGLIVLYAISPGLAAANKDIGENYYATRQLVALALGIVAFVALAHIPLTFWQRMQKPLLIAAALAAVAVRLFGEQINGAYRWIQVGGMSFQAVELIKFALLIWLATYLVQRMKEGTISDFKTLKPLLLVLLIVGFVVGIVQSDLGSAAVIVAMMAAMVFVAGLPMKRILIVGGIVAIGAFLLIAPSAYRRDRLMTYMNPEADCQNSGYQVCQALITVGSGGVLGLGVANSVQAYGYLPEAANDSIFAIMAEKFGFIGVAALIGLFVGLFSRLFKIAERAPDEYSRLLVVGILAWLSTQVIINVGAMLGLLPLKGITLPFMSYGGTSLIFVLGAVGLVFQVSRYTTFQISRAGAYNEPKQGRTHEGTTHRRRDGRAHHTAVSRRPEA